MCYNLGVMGDVLEIAQYDQLTETYVKDYNSRTYCPLKHHARGLGGQDELGDEGIVFIYEQV